MTVAREVRVHGSVQGVFFRDSCRKKAGERKVRGWVRNEPDGSVAAYFEGDLDAVEELVAWCHTGPPRATVAGVEVREVPAQGATAFQVL